MNETIKLQSGQRKAVIINAGVEIANRDGLAKVNHASVAEACSVKTSKWCVKYYYPTKPDLWSAILASKSVTEDVMSEAKMMGVVK